MNDKIFEKMQKDARILQAVKSKRKRTYIWFFIFAAVALYLAFMLCLLCECNTVTWILTLGLLTAVGVIVFWRLRSFPVSSCHLSEIVRMEESWKRVPAKGTAAFGKLPMYTREVRELQILLLDEEKRTHVIFCPSQYERLLALGDLLLTHSALPYPAHLSNPTKCICMHCGTMQASENASCITCGADIYSLYTVK